MEEQIKTIAENAIKEIGYFGEKYDIDSLKSNINE